MVNKKRGMAHIEMAISFGMFALFTFWLIVFLNPVKNQSISNVLIDTVERGIIRNASLDVAEVPVNAVAPANASRLKIKNPFNTTLTSNMFVRDVNDKLLKFSFPEPGNISIEKSGIFYRLYYGDATFNPPLLSGPCTALNPNQMNYTSARVSTPLFIARVEYVKWLYENNYDALKDEFSFPHTSDFSINITNLLTKQNLFEMRKTKPQRVDVIAREIPVEIIQRDGSIIRAIMNLQVW